MRLLIFKVNQLGDNVVFLPVVQHLRKVLPPGTEMVILTSPVASPLYEHAVPGVKVETAPTADFNNAWRNPLSLFRLIKKMRGMAPDVCLLAEDQSNVAHLLAWAGGARLRVGPLLPTMKLGFLLTHRHPVDLTERVALQNWRLARELLRVLGIAADEMPPYPPPPHMDNFRLDGEVRRPLVIIHPGASQWHKCWPMDGYVELANRLAPAGEVRFVTQGKAGEERLHAAVQRWQPASLKEFIGWMGKANLFVGNNSGPMNIASAWGIPSVILNGLSTRSWDPAWHEERFDVLRNPDAECLPGKELAAEAERCRLKGERMPWMERWTVDEVHRRALRRLEDSAVS